MARERSSPKNSQMPTDHDVVVEVRESFDSFYQREFRNLAALAAAITGDRSTAEDIAQEALIRSHKRWDRVGGFDKPGAWARRVTINLASSARRRRAIEIKAKLRLGGRREPTMPSAREDHDDVWAAVASLPTNQRAAMALHYLEDRSVDEIADVLECAPSTARVHLHRGRKALREQLGGQP